MSVEILSVQNKSLADKKGIKAGFVLQTMNGHDINDVLDYQFYIKEEKLVLQYTNLKGKTKTTKIKKDEFDDIGLEFETYLIDKQLSCKNKCIFCFIDQLPKGMRESLYFKDDDARLSFLFGNYITLTNLTDANVQRIIDMHISPVNISVHTMNKELRVKMMKNKNSGDSLEIIHRLADAGISMNSQLVLCPHINDGKELEYSLQELSKLYPSVQSIAAVPFGMTKFREGLCQIEPYNEQTASSVVDIIEKFGNEFFNLHGTRLVYASDEFYLKAKKPLPDASYYENYPQIENGVGMCTSLKDEFIEAIEDFDGDKTIENHISMATGVGAYDLILSLSEKLMQNFPNIKIDVHKINNDFFGHTITVAGLITGNDLINQLKGKKLGNKLLIPNTMLRREGDLFLDDVSLEDVEKSLDIKIQVVGEFGSDLFDAIID
ncbi:MAG: DUF512 domain-containing protein [Clostridia bacterium]